MSGGVDSAVAALLAARGRTVAVTLELWADEANDAEASCCSAHAVRVARSLAHGMGMPHFTLDLRSEFRAGVVEPWLAGHAAGETPNPCVGCNGHVRLDAMLEFADALGCAALATGHYARVSEDGLLRCAADPAKDQAYMLCALSPATLARMRFPLGELTKPEVRALAAEADLPVASKADSQDLCFLAGTGRAAFLARHGGARERPGEIVDRGGRVLGRHRGHHGFTVGQRKGIGVAAPEPLYVLATDARTNRVTVGARAELATREVAVRGAMLHRPGEEVDSVRLRYRSQAAAVHGGGGGEGAADAPPRRAVRRRGARARPLACTPATWSSATARSASTNVNGGWVGRRFGRAEASVLPKCRLATPGQDGCRRGRSNPTPTQPPLTFAGSRRRRPRRRRTSSIALGRTCSPQRAQTMSAPTSPPQSRCSVRRGGPSGA